MNRDNAPFAVLGLDAVICNGVYEEDSFIISAGNIVDAVNRATELLEAVAKEFSAEKWSIWNVGIMEQNNKREFKASPLQKAAHVVTAYSSDLQLVLGQVLTDEKSNEITAIPELLDTLDIKGATVTIDAMGTQTAIAEQIIDQGADYILGLKENQPTLLEDARFYFEQDYSKVSRQALSEAGCYARTVEKGHGRIDTRECWLIKGDTASFRRANVWKKLGGIAVIRSTRSVAGSHTSETYRYYLFSHESLTAENFLALQRRHWAVENNLHWVLDVVFREDDLHARAEHEFSDLIERGRVDVIQPDLSRCGGFTVARKIADMAVMRSLSIIPHAFKTGILMAATLQYIASLPYAVLLECCEQDTILRQTLTDPILSIDQNGFMKIPQRPGLGVELNRDVIDRYRVG